MAELSEAEKEHLNDCFKNFKRDLYERMKIPAIGLAAMIAVLISIFATVIYMQARKDVMDAQLSVLNAQSEFAAVKKEFYEDATAAREDLDVMTEAYKVKLEVWNELAKEAEASVRRISSYEETLEQIAINFVAMDAVSPAKRATADASARPRVKIMSPSESTVEHMEEPPPLKIEESPGPRPARNDQIFQIPPQRSTLK